MTKFCSSAPHSRSFISTNEERDDKSVFFFEKLEAGTWEIRYGMRAVTPGDFRALPVQATAMYVPEITANSDAQRVKIQRAK